MDSVLVGEGRERPKVGGRQVERHQKLEVEKWKGSPTGRSSTYYTCHRTFDILIIASMRGINLGEKTEHYNGNAVIRGAWFD